MPGTRELDKNTGSAAKIERMRPAHISDVKRIEMENNLSPWTAEDYRAELERADSLAIVARADKKIVGFLVARLITPEEKDHEHSEIAEKAEIIENIENIENNEKILGEAEIYNIAVLDDHQKRGIGRLLIDTLVRRARTDKIGKIWLEVRESNEKALGFYQKKGFSEVFRRRSFYASPVEDAIVMALDLRGV